MEQTKSMTAFDALMDNTLKKIQATAPERVPTEKEKMTQAEDLIERGYMPFDKDSFREICTYLAASNGKGLLLTGKAGTGKTHLFRTRFPNTRICTAAKIEQAWRDSGKLEGNFWYDTYRLFLSEEQSHKVNLIVDDLGQEPVTKSYGNVSEAIEQFVCQRYQEWQTHKVRTLFSTNLTPSELDSRYGRRVTDRLQEMCVLIVMNGKSMRGAK
jgi:DNA replication protein DnaC